MSGILLRIWPGGRLTIPGVVCALCAVQTATAEKCGVPGGFPIFKFVRYAKGVNGRAVFLLEFTASSPVLRCPQNTFFADFAVKSTTGTTSTSQFFL